MVYAEMKGVGQRILLRLKAVGAGLFHEFLDVDRDRLEAERGERLGVQLAHLRADAQTFAIGWRTDRTHAVREVAKTVVPETEHAKSGALVHALREQAAEL